MDRHRISKLQVVQEFIGIGNKPSLVKRNGHGFRKCVDLQDCPEIAVEDSFSAFRNEIVTGADLPGQLVIVLGLHDLISLPQDAVPMRDLFFFTAFRIQKVLEDGIQPDRAEQPFPHRGQHLNLIRIRFHIRGELLLDQLERYIDDFIRFITFQEEEILTLIIRNLSRAFIDRMCVQDDIALRCLSENML